MGTTEDEVINICRASNKFDDESSALAYLKLTNDYFVETTPNVEREDEEDDGYQYGEGDDIDEGEEGVQKDIWTITQE